MTITIVETGESFDSIEKIAVRLNVEKNTISNALYRNTKVRKYTLIREHDRNDLNYEERFKLEWNDVCEQLKRSGHDLSKIPIKCMNPHSIHCID